MSDDDTTHPKRGPQVQDILTAVGLLTRVPVPYVAHDTANRPEATVWAYPIAGFVVALVALIVGTIAKWFGLGPEIIAALILTVKVISTGAMHEDGLADSADGLWGGWTQDRRLEIMKDSRIGTYGVIALVLGLLIRWIALTALIEHGAMWAGVIVAAVTSRVPMVALMHLLPNARGKGLSASVGRPEKTMLGYAVIIGLAVSAILTGLAVVPLFIFLCGITAASYAIAKAKIGGQTGDILGASQQLAEVTALIVLASFTG